MGKIVPLRLKSCFVEVFQILLCTLIFIYSCIFCGRKMRTKIASLQNSRRVVQPKVKFWCSTQEFCSGYHEDFRKIVLLWWPGGALKL